MEIAKALALHAATPAEWAVLITAGYYIPLPRNKFASHAEWEARAGCPRTENDVTEAQVAEAIDSCLLKGWIQLTEKGHVEQHRDVFGRLTGGRPEDPVGCTEYPADGIVLTELGQKVHSAIAIAHLGRAYFETAKPDMTGT